MIFNFVYSDEYNIFEDYCYHGVNVDFTGIKIFDSVLYGYVSVTAPSPRALQLLRKFILDNKFTVTES